MVKRAICTGDYHHRKGTIMEWDAEKAERGTATCGWYYTREGTRAMSALWGETMEWMVRMGHAKVVSVPLVWWDGQELF